MVGQTYTNIEVNLNVTRLLLEDGRRRCLYQRAWDSISVHHGLAEIQRMRTITSMGVQTDITPQGLPGENLDPLCTTGIPGTGRVKARR